MTDLVRLAAPRSAEEIGGPVTTAPARHRVAEVLIRIAVRVLVALSLVLLGFVFLEAWLPGIVVETMGSWLPD